MSWEILREVEVRSGVRAVAAHARRTNYRLRISGLI